MIFHSSVKYLGKTDGESTLRNAASFRDEGRLIRQSWRLIVRERWGVGVMYNIWQSAQRRTTHANGRSPCIWLDRWSLQCALCYGPSRLHLQSTPRPGSSVRRCLSIKLPWNFSAIASATLNLLSMQRVICDQKITLKHLVRGKQISQGHIRQYHRLALLTVMTWSVARFLCSSWASCIKRNNTLLNELLIHSHINCLPWTKSSFFNFLKEIERRP